MPQVAREVRTVKFEEAMIDTISMKLVMAPQQYDVGLTTNQSATSSPIRRGIGRRTGPRAGYASGKDKRWSAGDPRLGARHRRRKLANPYAMIMSGQIAARWLGRKRGEPRRAPAAQRIETPWRGRSSREST